MNLYIETKPEPKAGVHLSNTYVVRATKDGFAAIHRLDVVDQGAGMLDDMKVTVEDLFRDHEVSAKHGL